MGGHSCYEGGHRAHGGPPSPPPPPQGKTLPGMSVFGRSAVVSLAFKKQFYKELQTPFLIENNNKNNRTIEKNNRKVDPVFKNELYKRQEYTAECRRGYKYENGQHQEISRIYVNGKCSYPWAKMNGKCPTPPAQKTDKSLTLYRGEETLGDSLDTSKAWKWRLTLSY